MSSRNCRYVVRVKAKSCDFADLWKKAREFAGSTDRYVEILDGQMCFHFETVKAQVHFIWYVLAHDFEFVGR